MNPARCPRHMLPMLMKSVVPALSHTEWKVRRAALVALAMVAEGCVDPMREGLDTLLPLLLPRLKVGTMRRYTPLLRGLRSHSA